MKEIIRLNHISAENEEGHSLNDYCLTIFEGEIICVYGFHGSGKRILQGTLLGEIPITSGSIYIKEDKIMNYNSGVAAKSGIFIIDAKKRLIPGLSIEENLFAVKNKKHLFTIFNRRAARHQLTKHLEQIELTSIENKRVDELTLFENQMICIAKALTNKVKLIILNCSQYYYNDYEINKLTTIMKKMTKEGVSFLILCDKQNLFMSVADKIQYIQDGTDLFFYDYQQLLKHQFVTENKQSAMEANDAKKQLIYGFTDVSWTSSLDFTAYWNKVSKQNPELVKRIGEFNVGNNAYIISENSALYLIPTLSIQNNVCVSIYSKKPSFGIIKNSITKFVMKEFYKITGISSKKKTLEELTYFEKKLVSIFRFELIHPNFIIFENPYLGLDQMECEKLRSYFTHLVSKNIKLILFSNSYEELKQSCSEIIITENGMLLRTKNDTLS